MLESYAPAPSPDGSVAGGTTAACDAMPDPGVGLSRSSSPRYAPMSDAPTTLAELFRSLGLSMTVRADEAEAEAWACTLTRPDGVTYEIESVSFFDVDPDTGEEWIVEPTPSRVLSVLAGVDAEL